MPKLVLGNNFVNVGITSRYYKYQVAYWGEQRIPTLPTYTRHTIARSEKDRFWVITKPREFRPDLVAFEEYGYSNFWWRILEANQMKSIFDFKSGTNIRLPATIV